MPHGDAVTEYAKVQAVTMMIARSQRWFLKKFFIVISVRTSRLRDVLQDFSREQKLRR